MPATLTPVRPAVLPMDEIPLIARRDTTLPTLGYVVWGSLAGARITHTDLYDRLADAGLADHLPKPVSYTVSVRRALMALLGAHNAVTTLPDEETLDQDASQVKLFLRSVTEPGTGCTVFVLVQENVNLSALGIKHQTALRLMLHRKQGWVAVTTARAGSIPPLPADSVLPGEIVALDDEARPFVQALTPIWRRYIDLHFPSDLSEMLRSILCGLRKPGQPARDAIEEGMNAVAVKDGGDVYLVAANQREPLTRAMRFVNGLPHTGYRQPHLVVMGFVDEEYTKRGMATATHNGLLAEIGELRKDLATLGKSDKHRTTTLPARLEAYRQLRDKIELYAGLLGMQQGELQHEMEQLKAEAIALLSPTPAPDKEEPPYGQPLLTSYGRLPIAGP